MTADVVQGFVDSTSGGIVAGWASGIPPDGPVEVELVIDGLPYTKALAARFRDDLAQLGIGSGHHGFSLPIPTFFFDGQPHTVAVRVAGGGELRPDPPITVLGTPAAAPLAPADLPPPAQPPPPRPLARAPLASPTLAAPTLAAPALAQTVELSVIMPTYGRGTIMEASVLRYLQCAKHVPSEIIVVDDGSRDDTPDRLARLAAAHPNLTTRRVANGGPAQARNLAATLARGRLLMFVGDDVTPPSDDFLSIHAAAHQRFPERGTAVLGRIAWPDRAELPVNAVMAHIQGAGEQQFGYHHMVPYSWYDWRLFYSSNVSVKRALVPDWQTHGYDSSFTLAAFEDPEFALRTSLQLKEMGEEFRLFYAPAAHLVHHHPYTVAGFLARQVSVGMMAQRFLELHPGRADDLGLGAVQKRLADPGNGDDFPVEHYFAIFEGLKSWALVIENHYGLGQQNWHADLLKTVFRLAFMEGFIRVQAGAQVNIASACRYILEDVRSTMNRAIATEVLGQLPGFGLV